MPDINGPGNEPSEKRRFISEKIVKQKLTKGQIAKRAIAFLLSAVIFGAVAAVTFVVSKPFAEKYLARETEAESPPITFPKDEPETIAPTVPVTETAVPEETKESEPVEDIVQSALKKYQFNMDDLNGLYNNLRKICQEADKGVVAVHSVKTQMDWFDNPVENTGLFAGAVVALTNREVLILTPEGAVEAADSIRVAFADGTEVAGTIKQTDKMSGMAIVSVNTSDLDESLFKTVKAIELGNSYSVKQGDLVVAVGSPSGTVHSTGYGFVSYVTRNVQITDGMTRVIYADLKSDAQAGTFLLNTDGQIIGWVTDEYKKEGNGDMTIAMGISDYKSALGKMTNGMPIPYFGVQGQEVNESMVEGGMPKGIYVVDSVTNGPAYSAGIQSGDIIVKIGEKEITTQKDFQVQIESLKSDDIVPVTILRSGREEYKELEYQVTIGAR